MIFRKPYTYLHKDAEKNHPLEGAAPFFAVFRLLNIYPNYKINRHRPNDISVCNRFERRDEWRATVKCEDGSLAEPPAALEQ